MTRKTSSGRGTPANADPSNSDEHDDVAEWLIDKIAQHALHKILEENRKVRVLEDRVQSLEPRLRELGDDPRSFSSSI